MNDVSLKAKIRNISKDMNRRWDGYVRQMPYATGISFTATLDVIKELLE